MTKADETTSTEIARLPARGGALMESLGVRFSDPEEIQWEIAERLALAQTPEQLFGDSGPLSLRENRGRAFYIQRIRYLPSGFDGGPGFYALINATDATTDEPLVFTSGAMNVLIQLARAEQMGWLDRPVRAEQSEEPTANGFYPYRLVFS